MVEDVSDGGVSDDGSVSVGDAVYPLSSQRGKFDAWAQFAIIADPVARGDEGG